MNQLPKINTSRLHLRSSDGSENDLDSIYEIYSHPNVVRYLDHLAWTNRSQAEELIQSAHESNIFAWCVTLKNTHHVIGTCALFNHEPDHKTAEIGYSFHPDYWGQGYATEILPPLINFGFTNLKLNRIHAEVDPRNKASVQILQRVGFQQEGLIRECWIYPDQEPSDNLILGLLRREWVAN